MKKPRKPSTNMTLSTKTLRQAASLKRVMNRNLTNLVEQLIDERYEQLRGKPKQEAA